MVTGGDSDAGSRLTNENTGIAFSGDPGACAPRVLIGIVGKFL